MTCNSVKFGYAIVLGIGMRIFSIGLSQTKHNSKHISIHRFKKSTELTNATAKVASLPPPWGHAPKTPTASGIATKQTYKYIPPSNNGFFFSCFASGFNSLSKSSMMCTCVFLPPYFLYALSNASLIELSVA